VAKTKRRSIRSRVRLTKKHIDLLKSIVKAPWEYLEKIDDEHKIEKFEILIISEMLTFPGMLGTFGS